MACTKNSTEESNRAVEFRAKIPPSAWWIIFFPGQFVRGSVFFSSAPGGRSGGVCGGGSRSMDGAAGVAAVWSSLRSVAAVAALGRSRGRGCLGAAGCSTAAGG
uniref:Uncharacterized protein n=1 Tax=Populus alba TaxID=43335 RepID=A0A4U5N9E2_POPAL|nr:hypothetical protein D5086_0000272010 [Populus alba]